MSQANNESVPSFFGGSITEPNTLPRCPLCNYRRMLAHERTAGMCEGCAEDRGIAIEQEVA